jgi:three-Cys-motif partner protein
LTLEFVGDAISLSGLTGTKLKCDVIGEYYPFWWNITSGGKKKEHRLPTAIVELDAATGEVYIKDSKETILGSAGHALELKAKASFTENLKVVLIEKDSGCYYHLKNVIRRRWPNISVEEAEGPISSNTSNIYLLNITLDNALEKIKELELGNALFFFDPLRNVEFVTIDRVARERIKTFYGTRTEFIIFVFTSDWFLGRDESAPLPSTSKENSWTEDEKKTVLEADSLFGDREWRIYLLNDDPIEKKEENLIRLYKGRLHKWFRYVLPLPFNPKQNQIFHLILCSNFEAGVRATRDFYSTKTGNPKYSPNNADAYRIFCTLHPEISIELNGRRKPLHWRILWMTIMQHEEGICDYKCKDFRKIEPDAEKCQQVLDWLEEKKYIDPVNFKNAWGSSIKQYRLNWTIIKDRMGVDPPPPLRPLSSKEIRKWEI